MERGDIRQMFSHQLLLAIFFKQCSWFEITGRKKEQPWWAENARNTCPGRPGEGCLSYASTFMFPPDANNFSPKKAGISSEVSMACLCRLAKICGVSSSSSVSITSLATLGLARSGQSLQFRAQDCRAPGIASHLTPIAMILCLLVDRRLRSSSSRFLPRSSPCRPSLQSQPRASLR